MEEQIWNYAVYIKKMSKYVYIINKDSQIFHSQGKEL